MNLTKCKRCGGFFPDDCIFSNGNENWYCYQCMNASQGEMTMEYKRQECHNLINELPDNAFDEFTIELKNMKKFYEEREQYRKECERLDTLPAHGHNVTMVQCKIVGQEICSPLSKEYDKEDERECRYNMFGKCCWTCEKEDCFNHREQHPPFEGNEGRDCHNYQEPHFLTRRVIRNDYLKDLGFDELTEDQKEDFLLDNLLSLGKI